MIVCITSSRGLNLFDTAYTENPAKFDEQYAALLLANLVTHKLCMGSCTVIMLGGCIMKRVASYLHVSPSKQDTDNQRRELEVVAKRSG